MKSIALLFILILLSNEVLCQAPTFGTGSGGSIGGTLQLAGSNFSAGGNIVYVGAARAQVTLENSNEIRVTVPTGATYGPVTVISGGKVGVSRLPYLPVFPWNETITPSTFDQSLDFGAGELADKILVSDLDGNGRPDIIRINSNGTISITPNNSTLTKIAYLASFNLYIGNSVNCACSIAISDLDGDGKFDIVSGDRGTISVFKNVHSTGVLSANSFESRVVVPQVLAGSDKVIISDVDLDGRQEILVSSLASTKISVLPNISTLGVLNTGSFGAKVEYDVGYAVSDFAVGDLDADSKPDLVVQRNINTIVLYTNTSSVGTIDASSYTLAVDAVIQAGQSEILLADMDRDNKLDIVGLGGGSKLLIFPNSSPIGTITFDLANPIVFTTPNSKRFVGINDVNGDQNLDVLLSSISNGEVSVYPNVHPFGSGPFSATSFAPVVDIAIDIDRGIIADFDGDASPDLISSFNNGSGNYIGLHRNTLGFRSPVISELFPPTGVSGTVVTILGTGFSTTASNNTVQFSSSSGLITSTVSAATTTSLTTTVPAGAITDPIHVFRKGQMMAYNPEGYDQFLNSQENFKPFTVTLIEEENYPEESISEDGIGLTVGIKVSDRNQTAAINFVSHGFSRPETEVDTELLTSSTSVFEKVFTQTEIVDPLGLSFYFEAITTSGVKYTSSKATILRKYGAGSPALKLSQLRFGDQVSDYQIISTPMKIVNNKVTNVFDELLPYDNTQWRLFDYLDGETREYPKFTTFDVGRGYWLITRDEKIIDLGAGEVDHIMDNTSSGLGYYFCCIGFRSGWNLIGNPFPFSVAWSDIKSYNASSVANMGDLKVFKDGKLGISDTLEPFGGGFVFNSGSLNYSLAVPTAGNPNPGRRNTSNIKTSDLDATGWEVPLQLSNGSLVNELGGIGMYPDAKISGKDKYDEVSLPLPEGLDFFEMTFDHPELKAVFNKEVVPTTDATRWEFTVSRARQYKDLMLSWDNSSFGEGENQLMLFDVNTLEVVDMRKVSSYRINERTQRLQVLFGPREYIVETLDQYLPVVGDPYPNPSSGRVSIPFRIPESYAVGNVQFWVYDLSGAELQNSGVLEYPKGDHQYNIELSHGSGLKIIRVKVVSKPDEYRKVVFK